jgi:hypothetical protein
MGSASSACFETQPTEHKVNGGGRSLLCSMAGASPAVGPGALVGRTGSVWCAVDRSFLRPVSGDEPARSPASLGAGDGSVEPRDWKSGAWFSWLPCSSSSFFVSSAVVVSSLVCFVVCVGSNRAGSGVPIPPASSAESALHHCRSTGKGPPVAVGPRAGHIS